MTARKKIFSTLAMLVVTSMVVPSSIYASNQKTVLIDAGHGGHDNGSNHNGYFEDEINLQISKLVVSKLEKYNLEVISTREEDLYISLSKRAEMANESSADLFVSIHQNASEKKDPNGIETFYLGDNQKLAKIMQENIIKATNANDRGEKKANLQVLRDNKVPAVLVECGFISNPAEGYKLSTIEYQEKVADGIVDGILEYLEIERVLSINNYKIALDNVNVRSDRDKNSKIIGSLPKGTKVNVIDCKFDWLKIEYNGEIGYVSGVYVK